MATLDYRTTCELNRPVTIKHLDGMFFSQDVKANRIVVNVVRGGVIESLSGSVSANIIRADGSTVVQTGSISGNVASVVMPSSAYAVPGAIAVFVKHTASGVTSTIAAVTGYVYKSTTDTIVDPGTVVPNINELLAKIADCDAATAACIAATAAAPVIDDTAGTGATNKVWSANKTAGEVSEVKKQIRSISEARKNLLPIESKSTTLHNVVRSYSDGIFTSNGTANDSGGRNSAITPNFTLPAGTYTISKTVVSGSSRTLYIVFTDDSTYETFPSSDGSMTFTISAQRTAFISAGYSNGSSYTFEYKLQLEAGTSATDFVAPSYASAIDVVCRASSAETAAKVAILEPKVEDIEDDLSEIQTAVEKGISISKNLLPVGEKTSEVYTVVRKYGDGVIKSSGTANDSGGRNIGFTPNFTLPAGIYTISRTIVTGSAKTLYIVFADDSTYETFSSSDTSMTFTLSTKRTMFISAGYSVNGNADFEYKLQIESGSVATAFEEPSKTTAVDKVARNVLTHVKVMSYNVGSYNDGTSKDFTPAEQEEITGIYRKFFNEQICDILGLQEAKTNFSTGNPVNPEIYNQLYPYFSDSTNTSSVKSRFKFKEKGTYDISTDTGDNRHCAYGVCDIAGHEVYVVTAHFSPYSAAYREDNYAEMISILKQHDYFICFGDFNCGDDPTEYDAFIEEGFNIANCDYVGVLNTMKREVGSNTPRPNDNIVTSGNIMITGVKVLEDLANTLKSDHLPIVADLIFNVL